MLRAFLSVERLKAKESFFSGHIIMYTTGQYFNCSVITKSSQTKDQHQLPNCTKEKHVSHFWIRNWYQLVSKGITIYNTRKSSTWAIQNDSHKFDVVLLILKRHACTLDYTFTYTTLVYSKPAVMSQCWKLFQYIKYMKKKFFNDFILKLVLFF